MGTVHASSGQVTNADTGGATKNTNRIEKGRLVENVDLIEIPVGDAASIYRFFRIPWNARISDLHYVCDAITGLVADVGVYRTVPDGGAVVDADEFASAAVMSSALKVWTDILFEATATDIDRAKKPLWEVIGETTEPIGRYYDIAVTSTVAATAVATLVLRIRYIEG